MPVWLQIILACVNGLVVPALFGLGWLLKRFAVIEQAVAGTQVKLAALKQSVLSQDRTCVERLEWLREMESTGRATHDAVVKIAAKLDIELGK